jgi:uncharacterized protein (TIGR03435 family)
MAMRHARRASSVLSVLLLTIGGYVALAQAPAASPQGETFEVVSVKPMKALPGRERWSNSPPSGHFTTSNITVQTLIRNAYFLKDFQIINAPGWTSADRFAIDAKGAPWNTTEQFKSRLQGILTDRFRLAVHGETREMPIFALVLARPDGRLGPDLRRSDIDCAEVARTRASTPRPASPTATEPCMKKAPESYLLVAGTMPLSSLADDLTTELKRTVVDRTGLTGNFDYRLRWSPDQSVDPTAPLIVTALQEQLGLKLESARGPVEVLVIDRVERPVPD